MGIFDIDYKNKCPLCGKNMDFIYGDMVCSECGYRTSYGKSSSNTQISSAAVSSQKQSEAPKISYTPPTHPTASASKPSQTSKKSGSKLVPVIACVIILYIIVSFAIYFVRVKGVTSANPHTDFKAVLPEEYSLPDIDFDIKQDLSEYYDSFDPYQKNEAYDSHPSENSDGIIKTVELIFNKDISEVTKEELASIKSLDFYYYDYYYKAVSCGIDTADKYIVKDFFLGDVSFYGSNFSIFPNLTGLYMEYGDIASLQGLSQLSSLSTDLTPAEIAALIDPAQITSLTLTDLFFAGDFSGIERFTNLESLSVDAYYIESIEPLASLKTLKELTILDGNNINSFKTLYEMPQLEYLYLDCEGLRDIGFVSNMPDLACLVVWNSEINNIDALAACSDSLTRLDLSYNYKLTDYAVVSQLTKLEDLSLYVPFSFDNPIKIPELGNMPKLSQLLLGNFEDFSELQYAPGLKSLTLYDVYAYDFSALASLRNLTSLKLYDMSLEPTALESVMELTNLEYISLDGSYIWGNAEALLSLPHLKEFHMADSVAGFDVANLMPNNSLEVLNLNYAELRALENGKWDYNDDSNILPLSKNTDIFTNYPSLRELYLAEHEIDNVTFAASIPYLEVLELTDNYVTDLTPIAILPNLESVMCYNNPIVNDGGLGSKVCLE